MVQAGYWILNALVLLAFPASFCLWVRALVRGVNHPRPFSVPLVAVRPRNRPFWSPAEFLVMLGTLVMVTAILQQYFLARGWIEIVPAGAESTVDPVRALLASTAAGAAGGSAALVAVFIWMRLLSRDWFAETALMPCGEDFKLAGVSALFILPVVLLISVLVSLWVPYTHPVLEEIGKSLEWPTFLAVFASTAVLTPVVEEVAFRLCLQGGLQGIADRKVDEDGMWRPRANWPIVVAGLVFAVMHWGGQGAAPIPLFFFSIGLGYVYRQTGRIAVPIIIHMILNGLTLATEFLRVQQAG